MKKFSAVSTLWVCVWACALALDPRPAHADGLELHTPSPRSVGRAGTLTVSEDGGAALHINPAGMARRDAWRVQVGTLTVDRDLVYQPEPAAGDPDGEPGRAELLARGAPTTAPHLGLQGRIGPLVVGLAYLDTSAFAMAQPSPRLDTPTDEVARIHPHRYAGIELEHRMHSLFAGAAMRVRPWLGVGVSVGAARLRVAEKRHLWAGMPGRDEAGDPSFDLVLGLAATDALVPRFNAGVLLAPLTLPLELAVSVSYDGDASLAGSAALEPLYQNGPIDVESADARARLMLPGRLLVRTGIRYLGERVSFEVGGDLSLHRGARPETWSISGLAVSNSLAARTELTSIGALTHARSHSVVRAALDYDVVSGFLWLSGGYAYASGASATAWLSPVLASTGEHTVALGVEGFWGGMSINVGYARTFSMATDNGLSTQRVANPFDSEGGAPTGQGRYRNPSDRVGVAVEMAWE